MKNLKGIIPVCYIGRGGRVVVVVEGAGGVRVVLDSFFRIFFQANFGSDHL